MPESQVHINLVNDLVFWISENHLNGDHHLVLADRPQTMGSQKPPRIDGYCPDAFARNTKSYELILGEAKTSWDLESLHTERQIGSFLKFCSISNSSLFVFAVPWHMARFGKNLLRQIQRRTNTQDVHVLVLENLKG